MNIGSSAGSQAAQQLMQATNNLKSMTTQQIQAVNNDVNNVKAHAVQTTAEMTSAAVDRAQRRIDLMV